MPFGRAPQSYGAISEEDDGLLHHDDYDRDLPPAGLKRRSFGTILISVIALAMVATAAIAYARVGSKVAEPSAGVFGDVEIAKGSKFQEGYGAPGSCTATSSPVAGGADVVAYRSGKLRAGSFVQGSAEFSATLNNYTFWFASDTHRTAFETDPWHYAPQFGAFCSWGISNEDIWTTSPLGPQADPLWWILARDRLYLFRSHLPWSKFQQNGADNVANNAALGNKRWTDWYGDIHSPRAPFNTGCLCTPDTCTDA